MEEFKGSPKLLLLADEIQELPTICSCGKKARMNARKVFGEYVTEGESVVIDGENKNTEYEPLCGNCYLEKVMKANKKNIKKLIYK